MIYLDNSATTKQDPRVTERMLEMMEASFGNPSSLHRMGLTAEKAVKEARSELIRTIDRGCHEGSVAFVSGGTEADNMAIFGAARAGRRRGNRIITTAVEHPAVLECCNRLKQEGFDVVRIGVDESCRIDIEALEEVADDKTILAAIMQVNNEVGTIMFTGQIAAAIRKKSPQALILCDAVQGFGKIQPPDDADMIAISGHKIHGPKGSGALWMRDALNIPAYIYGGGQEKGLRSGTENVPAIAGLALAAKIADEEREENFRRVSQLRQRLMDGLTSEIDDMTINSPRQVGEEAGTASPYILNVSFAGVRGEVILHTLEQDGIYVSTGSACSSNKKSSSHVLKAMGLSNEDIEGAIRFSMSAYNTQEEIDEAVLRTAEAVKRFRKLGSFR